MEYNCDKCDMGVKGLKCSKCDCDLEDGHINHEGTDVQVCKCPKCEKMIKSPQCCGTDMNAC